ADLQGPAAEAHAGLHRRRVLLGSRASPTIVTARSHYDLLCIGSGPAGQRAAVQAAKLGKRVAVVEKQRCVGGVSIETGTIPSSTFREGVRSFSARGSSPGGEVAPRVRPTMPQLLERVGSVIRREGDVVRDQLARNEIDLLHGRASFESAHELRVDSA